MKGRTSLLSSDNLMSHWGRIQSYQPMIETDSDLQKIGDKVNTIWYHHFADQRVLQLTISSCPGAMEHQADCCRRFELAPRDSSSVLHDASLKNPTLNHNAEKMMTSPTITPMKSARISPQVD